MKLSAKLVVAVAAVAALMTVQALAAPALVSSLEVGKYRHAACDEIGITFSLANTTGHSIYVLRWETPLQGIAGDILDVQRDGEPVPYVGRLYKWAEPRAQDYIEIKAGDAASVVFDPSAAYDMSVTGQYTIRFRGVLQEMEGDGSELGVLSAREADVIPSNEITLWMEGRERGADSQDGGAAGGGDLLGIYGVGTYTSCTSGQQSALSTALGNAGTMSTKAYNHLVAYPSGSTLYKTWFGTYNSSRFSTVKSHFTSLKNAFATKTFDFDCSCTENAYAYVYPTQPYKIYLCSVYWQAPATGRDSKAGTLVHETSHFNVVAGTRDYVYGETGAKKLALTNPKKAINNADNHEYFAEDQP